MPDTRRLHTRWILTTGALGGIIVGGGWFAWICYISTFPAVSPVSLSLSFRPWYRTGNWVAGGIAAVLGFCFFAVLARVIRYKPRRGST